MSRFEVQFILVFSLPVPVILGLVFGSFITFFTLTSILGSLSYKYMVNNRNRKEIISIFQDKDDIHFMLANDNWHTIKTNNSVDIETSIIDKLNSYLKSNIKRIDLINIDNKPLQNRLNNLVFS
jgi:hypothetical protein